MLRAAAQTDIMNQRGDSTGPSHLRRLEAEAIHIFREAVAETRNPVFLYSIGKDSSVLLHLALKAFHPSLPPFPLLHVASGWDFADMIRHRDATAARHGLRLIVAHNEEAAAAGIDPFATPTPQYTRLMLTDTLKRALQMHVALMFAFRGAVAADSQPVAVPDGYERLVAPYRLRRL